MDSNKASAENAEKKVGDERDVEIVGLSDNVARDAFKKGDVEASKAYHEAKLNAPEKHGGAGSDYVKSIVFGGLDGIITTFAIVAAVAGADLEAKVIILMGFSNVIADAISMGLGDYLSSKAENDNIMNERKREEWEYDNFPEGEIAEMVDIYVKKGFALEDAETIIKTYTKKPEYKDLFIDHMMVEELEQMVPSPDDNPAKDGLVTFISFVTFGSVPMWFYVAFEIAGWDDKAAMFTIACVATLMTMFALGAFKATVTKQSKWKSGLMMTLNGGLAAAAAFFTGWGLEEALDVKAS